MGGSLLGLAAASGGDLCLVVVVLMYLFSFLPWFFMLGVMSGWGAGGGAGSPGGVAGLPGVWAGCGFRNTARGFGALCGGCSLCDLILLWGGCVRA